MRETGRKNHMQLDPVTFMQATCVHFNKQILDAYEAGGLERVRDHLEGECPSPTPPTDQVLAGTVMNARQFIAAARHLMPDAMAVAESSAFRATLIWCQCPGAGRGPAPRVGVNLFGRVP